MSRRKGNELQGRVGGRRGGGGGTGSCQIGEGVSRDGHHGQCWHVEGERGSSTEDIPTIKCFLVSQERLCQAVHSLLSL